MEKPSIEEYLNYIGADTPAVGAGWRKMKCPFHGDVGAAEHWGVECFAQKVTLSNSKNCFNRTRRILGSR